MHTASNLQTSLMKMVFDSDLSGCQETSQHHAELVYSGSQKVLKSKAYFKQTRFIQERFAHENLELQWM